MNGVLEAKLRARELRRLPHIRLAVALDARVVVVRLFVAAPADGVGGEVERPRLPGGRDVRVALDAVDALEDMRAVLEGMGRRIVTQAEDAGAGRQGEREDHQQGEGRPHRGPPAGVAGGGPPSA